MSKSSKKKLDDKYGDAEAQRRFEAALKGAFATPPKPMKEIPRKRPRAKREPRAKR